MKGNTIMWVGLVAALVGLVVNNSAKATGSNSNVGNFLIVGGAAAAATTLF